MPTLITPVHLEKKKLAEKKVIKVFKISPDIFMTNKKSNESTGARFAVWCILYHQEGMSYPLIGQLYGKDHTTVLYGVRKAIMQLMPEMLGIKVLRTC